ncbi:hypothetical protein [Methylobacterium radiotolerans]|uniref:hypothetical protein n=1 Tax=Methylobacterium radiotolerans TaxID=31998 RepID=UPI001F3C2A9C|nr:hypothetical protein [Methylobacterium radiotolerans]UIY45593.1 hypothetical protein LZ599_31340 [Methylobacterium radiotolerans]
MSTGLTPAKLIGPIAALCACLAQPAAADPCDVQTAEVVEATGAQFVRRSRTGEGVQFSHPHAASLTMNCRDRDSLTPGRVIANVETAYPPNEFFDLVGRAAGASLKISATDARRLAMRCHKTALASASELAEADAKAIHVECQSFRRDGGGTIVSVWPPERRERP